MRQLLAIMAGFLMLCVALSAQNITGTISGTVVDPNDFAIPGVTVTIREAATGAESVTITNEVGLFHFAAVRPGAYDLTAEMPGFKTFVSKGHRVSATQRLSVGRLIMTIGEVDELVTVSGSIETVQTTSAERSGLVDRSQLERLQTMSGDPLDLVILLPGFISQAVNPAMQAPQTPRQITAYGLVNSTNFTLDGVGTLNSANNNNLTIALNVNAVEEVQVQLANFQAEYGRRAGPSVNIITRSGGRDFHGSVYYYRRHEKLNANAHFRKLNDLPRARYRYQTRGFTLGGPVYIPGRFNSDKSSLFFFFSASQQPAVTPPGVTQLTMPSLLERQGDFSQTLNNQGALVPIRDPLTGQPFPGNLVPANRISPVGQAILSFFPEPNFVDPTGRFNFNKSMLPYQSPSREEMVRIDWVPSSNFTVSGRYAQETNRIINFVAHWSDQMEQHFPRPGKNISIRTNHSVSPTLANEMTFGYNRLGDMQYVEDKYLPMLQRESVGINLGQFNPPGNPMGLVPRLDFGALPNGGSSPNINLNLKDGLIQAFSGANNTTKVHGAHILKFGVYVERALNDQGPVGGNGALNFASNPANPNNTGHPYSNALLGFFNTYSEPIGLEWNRMRFWNVEWYLQDNWRVTRRFTLDYGMRFYWQPPETEKNNRLAVFDPSRFDPAKAVRLYMPHNEPGKGKVGRDPVTGELVPAAYIGAIIPGSGDPYNGMVKASERSPFKDQGIVLAPRFGFAYDPWGDGKTAIRGGFGLFYSRATGSMVMALAGNPTVVETPTIYFGDLAHFLEASGVRFPQNVASFSEKGQLPTTMNFSLGVQRRVANLFVTDVAYVGSLSRHLPQTHNFNTTPFATNFLQANADPTGNKIPLPVAFLRPHLGYQNINMVDFGNSSNYHSMQVQLNRRFGSRLNLTSNWVWSKAMTYAFWEGGGRSMILGPWRDYTLADWDATHAFNVNWIYSLPGVNRFLGGTRVLGHVLDGWRLSGITRFQSGRPLGVNLQTPGIDITGSTEGARVNVTGNPTLPKNQRTLDRFFNTDVFAKPAHGVFGVTGPGDVDYGNAALMLFRGPGFEAWNFTLSKEFRLYEDHRFEIMAEFYNAFNQFVWSGVDANARFNAAGQQTNPGFGRVTGGHGPRIIQLGAKYSF
jgi:hypothetical protein